MSTNEPAAEPDTISTSFFTALSPFTTTRRKPKSTFTLQTSGNTCTRRARGWESSRWLTAAISSSAA